MNKSLKNIENYALRIDKSYYKLNYLFLNNELKWKNNDSFFSLLIIIIHKNIAETILWKKNSNFM